MNSVLSLFANLSEKNVSFRSCFVLHFISLCLVSKKFKVRSGGRERENEAKREGEDDLLLDGAAAVWISVLYARADYFLKK